MQKIYGRYQNKSAQGTMKYNEVRNRVRRWLVQQKKYRTINEEIQSE